MSRYADLLNRLEKQREIPKKMPDLPMSTISLPKARGFRLNRFYFYLIFALAAFFTLSLYFFGVIQGMRLAMESSGRGELLTEAEPVFQREVFPLPAEREDEAAQEILGTASPGEIFSQVSPAAADEIPPKAAFAIQLATYNQKTRADQEVLKLKERYPAAFVRESGKYQVLFLGVYPDREAARRELVAMKTAGLRDVFPDAFIRPFDE